MQKEEIKEGALICIYQDGKPFINTTVLSVRTIHGKGDFAILQGFEFPYPIKELRPFNRGYKNCDDLLTSEEWHKQEFAMYKILDPDGWDRSNYDYSWFIERISREEFQRRMMMSTTNVINVLRR